VSTHTPGAAAGSTLLPLGTAPADLARQYSTALGGFRPPPKPPAPNQGGGKARATHAQRAAAKESNWLVSEAKGAEESEDEVVAALVGHYRSNKAFAENVRLRREVQTAVRQLAAFEAHVAEQEAEAAAKMAVKRQRGGKKAGVAAGGVGKKVKGKR
jgi:hypothetical protein